MITRGFLRALSLSLAALSVTPVPAQEVGRVSPAALPLPLPGRRALPPDELRDHNPWNLPMTGTWRFALTHGRIKAGEYEPDQAGRLGLSASSNEEKNPPENAFDGRADTRWCASDDSVPQWLQTDLGTNRHVVGIGLVWEREGGGYLCRIEGKPDGRKWTTLADASTAPGLSDGPVKVAPADLRYVRVTVVGHAPGSWASIREFQVHVVQAGQDVVWDPLAQKPPAIPEAARDQFASTGFDDSGWDNLPVPSNWEMYGFSPPTYGWVDNTVGQYRRWVKVPMAWTGRRIYWHFDGALDGAEVFINGEKAGYHESGYTAWNLDVTELLKPGQLNLFAVRVSKSVPSSDCETGDFQCMGGIYRDTSLISVPSAHVADITVQTELDAAYRNARLRATVEVVGAAGDTAVLTGDLVDARTRARTGVTVSGQAFLGADGAASIALTAAVTAPALWSAEKPNLYYLVLQYASGGKTVERVEQRFGFKQIDFTNNQVWWNGRPIKCTGTCRHDYWADKGFALTEANWEQDVSLMKLANINAVRTSHYNHAQRFLELCEEKGLYVLDEIPYCWINEQVNDPRYAPYLLQRAAETLARDKNRPCVLAWSIGNENPMGTNSQAVMDLVRGADPTRPAFVSCIGRRDVKGQLWDDGHYPSPRDVDAVIRHGTPENYTENPHIFWQPETQSYDPGAHDLWSEALAGVWGKVWNAPTILGSFIWEWQNQGIANTNNNPAPHAGPWGVDNLFQENDKGIVTAYRVPKPEWWIVKQVYSPVQVGLGALSASGGFFSLPVTNRYSFTELNELKCRWAVFQGDSVLQRGVERIDCAPSASVAPRFPAPAGATKLRLEFDRADGAAVVAFNIPVAGAPVPQPPPALTAGDPLTSGEDAGTLRVANQLQEIVFDKQTGGIRSWRVRGREVVIGGPILNLGEAKASDEKAFYRAHNPPVARGATLTATSAADGTVRVSAAAEVLPDSGGTALGTLTLTYVLKPDAEMTLHWKLDWRAGATNLWEAGVKLTLPADMTTMRWLRDAYFTDYPPGHLGEASGACQADDVRFRASKRGLRWLTLTDRSGAGLALLAVDDTPLLARANAAAAATTLFASREAAGPRDFSGSWVSRHDIKARQDHPLSGAFTLRAVAP
jgi:beta-galactosidase